MAKNKTLELSIKIAGKVDKSLISALTGAQSQISGFSKGLGKIGTAGLAAMTALGAGTVKVIADCTQEAANFENYMSDVVKYVDGLADATGRVSDQISKETGRSYAQNYEMMKDAILDLSTQIPYTQQDLTRLAAAAGEAGYNINEIFQIDQSGNVTGFLRNIAMVGTALDVSADQAGDWAAKWEQAFNMSHEEIMVLFDQINYLGANSATTAAEIAHVVNEAASLGQLGGVSVSTTTALATAMLSTGVSADVVGTSIKRMYANMSKGQSATKAMKDAYIELGFTAEGIAQAMQTDGTGTILQVFEAIKQMPDHRQVATLNTLFGQWAIEGTGKILGNLDAYTEALRMVNDPSLYSGSMEREFIIKATTPEAIEAMRKNAWQALQIEFGDALVPAKKEFDLALIDFMNNVRENMPALERLAETLGQLASKGVTKLGEKMDEWLPKIQNGIDWVLNNSETVITTIKGIAAAFGLMKLAPAGEGLVRTIMGLFGGKKSTSDSSSLSAVGKMIVNAAVVYMNGKTVTDAANIPGNLADLAGGATKAGGAAAAGTVTKKGLWGWLSGLGTTITGGLASVGTALGSGAATTGGLAAAGGSGIAGGLLGGAGIISSIIDFFQGAKATDGKTKKTEYASGGAKLGMVGAGAGIGAAIGSVVPVIGTAIGALIGSGIGGLAALFGGDALGQWISDSTDVGGWMNNVWQAVKGFFTTTLPTFVTQTIPAAASSVGASISQFFTQTVPDFFGDLWDSICTFFTKDVPYAIGYACGKVDAFFMRDVPKYFTDLWNSICTFFSTTLPAWASNIWSNKIVPFFTVSLPSYVGGLWNSICSFFTQTVPSWASRIWSGKIVPFFTSSLPTYVGQLWNSISTFFTSTIPTWASSIWNNKIKPFFSTTLPGFFTTLWNSVTNFVTQAIPNFASSIWSKISGWFSSIKSWLDSFWSKVSGNYSSGYSDGYAAHAWGGIMRTPHIGLVAEAGPEAIIPLSRGKNARGVSLWMQAGRILGVGAQHLASVAGIGGFKPYADGGIAGKLPTRQIIREVMPIKVIELSPLEEKPRDNSPGGQGGFTFAPTIIVQGGADRDVIDEALAKAKAEFETWYRQMQRKQARTAY